MLSHLTHFQKRNRGKRYGLPILLIVLVFVIKHYFHSLLGDNSAFLMVSFIVAASSWHGGLGPGIFATLLTSLVTFFVFLKNDTAKHPLVGDIVLTAIFLIEGFIISIVSEARFEMEEQKDEFIAFLAHELKNPLTAIIGFSSLITKDARSSGNEKIVFYGESIRNSTKRLLTLINDLLDIANIEIGKFTYTYSTFNLTDLLKEVVFQQQIITKNRVLDVKGLSKHTLFADRYRIGQVITNLLTNAIKYSPESKKIALRLKEGKHTVLLSIRDFGAGIAKKDQKRIFNRFFRTDSVKKGTCQGLGLGLFICKQIVSYHKGKLWVKSKLGRGSTFFLEMPRYSKNN